MSEKISNREAGRMGGIRNAIAAKIRRKLRKDKYELDPKLCLFCHKKFLYEQRRNKFCSRSCAASFNNKGVKRHGESLKERYCEICKKQLKTNFSICCSSKCYNEKVSRDWIKSWINGERDGACGGKYQKVAKQVRNWLIKKQDGKCSICGMSEWMGGKVPLVLDHIDGNALNNTPGNLRIICRNCDGQLPTYCGRNMGKGKRKFTISYVK